MKFAHKLSLSDYNITDGHGKLAARNTFTLVNNTMACATNYSSKGSISLMWKRLLDKSPTKCPAHKTAFEDAKGVLYEDYDKDRRTELYQDYCKKEFALKQKELQMEREFKEIGDRWKDEFDKNLKASEEYLEFHRVAAVVKPCLDAIDLYIYGPLYHLKQGTQLCSYVATHYIRSYIILSS